MPKKNLIYERYNFLSARQNSCETIDAYVRRLRLLTKSCDWRFRRGSNSGSCCDELRFISFAVAPTVGKRSLSLSFSLLNFSKQLPGQCNYQIMRHQKGKHDDSINATEKLAIDKKDTSNDRYREMKCFRCGKSGHLANNKICKARSATCNLCQKVGHLASECRPKNKTNFVNEKKPEGIYYIDLSAPESDPPRKQRTSAIFRKRLFP